MKKESRSIDVGHLQGDAFSDLSSGAVVEADESATTEEDLAMYEMLGDALDQSEREYVAPPQRGAFFELFELLGLLVLLLVTRVAGDNSWIANKIRKGVW